MSQHYFHTLHHGEPITVLLGYDRPLGHVFMVVERDQPREDQDAYLYVNLEEPDAFDLDLEHFEAKLNELGIVVPRSMFEQVRIDQMNGVGNRMATHQVDSSFSCRPLGD